MRPSFFTNTGISFYKFPSKPCFSSLLQILLCYVFIFIQFKILPNFPFDFFFDPLGHLEIYYLVLKYLGILQIFPSLISILISLCQRTYSILFEFFEIYRGLFYGPRYLSILVNLLCAHEKNVFFAVIGWYVL